MKNITILGATGSIGTNTLKVIDLHLDKFKVFAISANTSVEKMVILCQKYQPQFAVMKHKMAALKLKKLTTTKVLAGDDGLSFIVSEKSVDMVMCAIVGAAGMLSALSAAKSGKRILLANKESLVLAGKLLMQAAKKNNAQIIPVDSEHSAIFQALQGREQDIDKIVLTASGGPFLHVPLSQLSKITPKQACNHPNWVMGKKISVDSSTMMNKGLEVIEAYYLFDVPASKIEVIVHPQSIVHSLVYYLDGSVISQLGNSDMRTAIAYSMSYPNRINSGVQKLNLSKHRLEFFNPDYNKFKCLSLAYQALKTSTSSIITLNASNEIAVAAFLAGKIKYLQIVNIIEKNLNNLPVVKIDNINDILATDKLAKIKASELL